MRIPFDAQVAREAATEDALVVLFEEPGGQVGSRCGKLAASQHSLLGLLACGLLGDGGVGSVPGQHEDVIAGSDLARPGSPRRPCSTRFASVRRRGHVRDGPRDVLVVAGRVYLNRGNGSGCGVGCGLCSPLSSSVRLRGGLGRALALDRLVLRADVGASTRPCATRVSGASVLVRRAILADREVAIAGLVGRHTIRVEVTLGAVITGILIVAILLIAAHIKEDLRHGRVARARGATRAARR
mmetsp:Transcript_2210/g.8787  ORF Transcript_2210/g.8787 Transcript_2210/m.8787 type:complete len:242 (+) Transcript_2210:681-1406(+)